MFVQGSEMRHGCCGPADTTQHSPRLPGTQHHCRSLRASTEDVPVGGRRERERHHTGMRARQTEQGAASVPSRHFRPHSDISKEVLLLSLIVILPGNVSRG